MSTVPKLNIRTAAMTPSAALGLQAFSAATVPERSTPARA